MIHKWQTIRALTKHFSFAIHGGPRGEPATLFNKMYKDVPEFAKYTPIMAAATYLVAYLMAYQDTTLAAHLDEVFPKLLAQGHLNTYQLAILDEFGKSMSRNIMR